MDEALHAYAVEGPMYIADQPLADGQQPTCLFIPNLPARPCWPSTPSLALLQVECAAILEEFQRLRAVATPLQRRGWTVFHMIEGGTWRPEHCERCPRTTELLKTLTICAGSLGGAYFSVLGPGADVLPQHGLTNATLRAQLILQGGDGAMLRLGEHRLPLEDGSLVLYDDSFMHASQGAVADEVVALVVDLWHPRLTTAECDKIATHFPARPIPGDSEEHVMSVLCSPWLSLEVASHLSGEQMPVAAQCCVAWREISMDEDLWQLYCTREGETRIEMESWRSTYIDLLAGRFAAPLPDYVSAKNDGRAFDYLCKFLLVGNSGAGKTSYMVRLVDDCFPPPVIGVEFKVKTVQFRKQQVKFQVWDTPDQRYYRPTYGHYRGTHIVLVLYDIASRESFENCQRYMPLIQLHAPENVVVGLVGCKSDLEHQREVQTQEGVALAAAWEQEQSSRGVFFTETSSLTGKNVERATARVVREWLKLMQQIEETPAPAEAPAPAKSKCVLC